MQTFRALTCLTAILTAASSEARSSLMHGRHLMQMAGEDMQAAALRRACSPKHDIPYALPVGIQVSEMAGCRRAPCIATPSMLMSMYARCLRGLRRHSVTLSLY